jgi:hypothetical protein
MIVKYISVVGHVNVHFVHLVFLTVFATSKTPTKGGISDAFAYQQQSRDMENVVTNVTIMVLRKNGKFAAQKVSDKHINDRSNANFADQGNRNDVSNTSSRNRT